MKKKFKEILIFLLLAMFLSGCSSVKFIYDDGKQNQNSETIIEKESTSDDGVIELEAIVNVKIRDYPSIIFGQHISKIKKGSRVTASEYTTNEKYTWYKISNNQWAPDDGTYFKLIGGNVNENPSYGTLQLATVTSENVQLYHLTINNNTATERNSDGTLTNPGDIFPILETVDYCGTNYYRVRDNYWIDSSFVNITDIETKGRDVTKGVFNIEINTGNSLNVHCGPSSNSGKPDPEIQYSQGTRLKVYEISYGEEQMWYRVNKDEWIRNHNNSFKIVN